MNLGIHAIAPAILSVAALGAQQLPPLPAGGALGQRESGAPVLSGYLVAGTPCLPLKKFAADAGYETNVSPSGRHIAVLIGMKTAYVLNDRIALIDGKETPLTVAVIRKNGDVYVPLDFYVRVFPARFTYNAKLKRVSAALQGKTLTVPIEPLPKDLKQP